MKNDSKSCKQKKRILSKQKRMKIIINDEKDK